MDIVAEDDDFRLFAKDADQQRIYRLVKILKSQSLAQDNRKAGSRLKAALSVLFIGVAEQFESALGALHSHGRLSDAAAGLDGNQALYILHGLCVHAVRRDNFNG